MCNNLLPAGATTYISDLDGDDEEKFFTFDYSYWSYDGFEDIDGYLTPSNEQYADQVSFVEGMILNWTGRYTNKALFS